MSQELLEQISQSWGDADILMKALCIGVFALLTLVILSLFFSIISSCCCSQKSAVNVDDLSTIAITTLHFLSSEKTVNNSQNPILQSS